MGTNCVKLIAERSGWRHYLALAVLMGAASFSARGAEDFNRIAPKQPPVTPMPPPTSPAQAQEPKGNPHQVLAKYLNALVFVPTPDAVVKTGLVDHGIDLKNVTPPKPEHFVSVVMPY